MNDDIEILREGARNGDPGALTALGKRLLFGDHAPASPQEGIALLREAASRNNGEAAALSARLAAWGVLQAKDPPRALDLLQEKALNWAGLRRKSNFAFGRKPMETIGARFDSVSP